MNARSALAAHHVAQDARSGLRTVTDQAEGAIARLRGSCEFSQFLQPDVRASARARFCEFCDPTGRAHARVKGPVHTLTQAARRGFTRAREGTRP